MNDSPAIDYQIIFEHAPVGLCISRHRVMQVCNRELTKIFGYEAGDLDGQSFQILYPTADEFERTGARIVPIMNAKGIYSDERIMRRANGDLFWCHVIGHTLVPNDMHAAGIWTFEDLSGKRKVSAELSPREREIAALLVEGKTSKLIGKQIGLSPRTVEMHRANLMKKFTAATSSELVHRLLGVVSQ